MHQASFQIFKNSVRQRIQARTVLLNYSYMMSRNSMTMKFVWSGQSRNLHNLEISLHILGIPKLRTNLEIARQKCAISRSSSGPFWTLVESKWATYKFVRNNELWGNEQAHNGLVRIFVAFHESRTAKNSWRFSRNLEIVLLTLGSRVFYAISRLVCDFQILRMYNPISRLCKFLDCAEHVYG